MVTRPWTGILLLRHIDLPAAAQPTYGSPATCGSPATARSPGHSSQPGHISQSRIHMHVRVDAELHMRVPQMAAWTTSRRTAHHSQPVARMHASVSPQLPAYSCPTSGSPPHISQSGPPFAALPTTDSLIRTHARVCWYRHMRIRAAAHIWQSGPHLAARPTTRSLLHVCMQV